MWTGIQFSRYNVPQGKSWWRSRCIVQSCTDIAWPYCFVPSTACGSKSQVVFSCEYQPHQKCKEFCLRSVVASYVSSFHRKLFINITPENWRFVNVLRQLCTRFAICLSLSAPYISQWSPLYLIFSGNTVPGLAAEIFVIILKGSPIFLRLTFLFPFHTVLISHFIFCFYPLCIFTFSVSVTLRLSVFTWSIACDLQKMYLRYSILSIFLIYTELHKANFIMLPFTVFYKCVCVCCLRLRSFRSPSSSVNGVHHNALGNDAISHIHLLRSRKLIFHLCLFWRNPLPHCHLRSSCHPFHVVPIA